MGPIPVSTSQRDTCPTTCLLKNNGCYAENFPMRYHWDAVDRGERGYEWDDFLLQIRALRKNQIWRHNQAGDLIGTGNEIDEFYLAGLAVANQGRRGFTYTHYPMTPHNQRCVQLANQHGFTINLSADSPAEADTLAALGIAPVVCMIPRGTPNTSSTPAGRKITRCPAEHVEYMTCAVCQLCQKVDRTTIVGFTVHGVRFKRAAKIIQLKSEKA